MKKLSAVLALSLLSSIAFAETNEYQYASYKEMYFHDLDSGTYSFVSTCTDNTLEWNKATKKYKRKIEKNTTKGFDMILHNGDTVKTVSNSVDSNGTKYYGEFETTFLDENKYIRHNNSRTVYADGTEFKYERVLEGVYINGTYNITKITLNGVETPVKKSTYVEVLNDNEANDTTEAYTYESNNVKEQMENPAYEDVLLRIDTICNYKSTKL